MRQAPPSRHHIGRSAAGVRFDPRNRFGSGYDVAEHGRRFRIEIAADRLDALRGFAETIRQEFDDLVATGTQALRVVPRAEVPEDVMDPRLAVTAAREGVLQADEDLDRLRDFWLD